MYLAQGLRFKTRRGHSAAGAESPERIMEAVFVHISAPSRKEREPRCSCSCTATGAPSHGHLGGPRAWPCWDRAKRSPQLHGSVLFPKSQRYCRILLGLLAVQGWQNLLLLHLVSHGSKWHWHSKRQGFGVAVLGGCPSGVPKGLQCPEGTLPGSKGQQGYVVSCWVVLGWQQWCGVLGSAMAQDSLAQSHSAAPSATHATARCWCGAH